MVAAPWSSADFLHGPIAIVEPGFPLLAIAPSGPTLDGMRELLAAARDRGADVTVIADDATVAGRRVALEPVPEWLNRSGRRPPGPAARGRGGQAPRRRRPPHRAEEGHAERHEPLLRAANSAAFAR